MSFDVDCLLRLLNQIHFNCRWSLQATRSLAMSLLRSSKFDSRWPCPCSSKYTNELGYFSFPKPLPLNFFSLANVGWIWTQQVTAPCICASYFRTRPNGICCFARVSWALDSKGFAAISRVAEATDYRGLFWRWVNPSGTFRSPIINNTYSHWLSAHRRDICRHIIDWFVLIKDVYNWSQLTIFVFSTRARTWIGWILPHQDASDLHFRRQT